ncbi:MAG TPA: Hint domain-containing protein [Sphingobium sp.]|uniref:Hint domain-containing protein n=1 Tax=Sphingobium sp. TaxID=1912891 RepID=UPI002ED6ADAC
MSNSKYAATTGPFAPNNSQPWFFVSTTGSVSELSYPLQFEADVSAYCFAEGTCIETAGGPMAVENLSEGDLMITASGDRRAVKWIGQQLVRPTLHDCPQDMSPVRILPHAFGPAMPSRDVRLSPGHAIYIDGVLVPVGHLVNGATIVQEAVERIRYFHVELDTHDVLIAEGLPCESYLDDGNRESFNTGDAVTQLHGRLDPKSWDDACAPLVAGGPQLVAIRERLDAQARALGWTKSEEPMLVLEADGVMITAEHRSGPRHWFRVPVAAMLALRSTAAVLAHVMPGLPDNRRLGVAISALRVDGAVIALDDDRLGVGFHPVEVHGDSQWRWTDGNAKLALANAGAVMLEIEIMMVAPTWQRAAPALRIAA